MFKQCLENGVMPFIIEDSYKAFYYKGLSEFNKERSWLTDTCLSMQDRYMEIINSLLSDNMF